MTPAWPEQVAVTRICVDGGDREGEAGRERYIYFKYMVGPIGKKRRW